MPRTTEPHPAAVRAARKIDGHALGVPLKAYSAFERTSIARAAEIIDAEYAPVLESARDVVKATEDACLRRLERLAERLNHIIGAATHFDSARPDMAYTYIADEARAALRDAGLGE